MRVATEGVVYISSDGNYSTLIQADGGSRILTVQLGQLEALISKQLVRDGKYVKESSRWKYSSRRRALCLKDGQCFIVETLEMETFPRFRMSSRTWMSMLQSISLAVSHTVMDVIMMERR